MLSSVNGGGEFPLELVLRAVCDVPKAGLLKDPFFQPREVKNIQALHTPYLILYMSRTLGAATQ